MEVKRTDLPEDANPGLRFFWLLVDLTTRDIQRLEFRSMSTGEDGWQLRGFAQGSMRFNETEAVFEDEHFPKIDSSSCWTDSDLTHAVSTMIHRS